MDKTTPRIQTAILVLLATVALTCLLSVPDEGHWPINILLVKPAGAFFAWQALRLARFWEKERQRQIKTSPK